MLESQLSPAAERALHSTQIASVDLPRDQLLSFALFAALIEDDEATPAMRLQSHGLELTTVRERIEPLRMNVEHTFQLPELLSATRDISREQGDYPHLTSDAVLLALLRIEKTLTRQLEAWGLQPTALSVESLLVESPTVDLQLAEPTEVIATARILDASANRAREALRVVEDYTRFALDDRFLTEQLKQLRHELTEVLEELPSSAFLESRETIRDIGTTISTDREQIRVNLLHVAQVNLKRWQEALRTLEEFGKLFDASIGQRFEQLRYRSYTLERAIVMGTTARQRLSNARLYVLLAGSQCVSSLEWTIAEAASGGAEIVQLREKGLNDRELLERAKNVRKWTSDAGVLFIMNDRPDIARLVSADGVHLGQDDLSVKEARQIVGPNAIIGVSTHDLDQLRQAILDGATYIGVGPAFATPTKPGIEVAGLEYVRAAMQETSLPAFVIGGVTLQTIDAVIASGANRVAVSSEIAKAEEPRQVAAIIRQALK